jgi:hypothetical protein
MIRQPLGLGVQCGFLGRKQLKNYPWVRGLSRNDAASNPGGEDPGSEEESDINENLSLFHLDITGLVGLSNNDPITTGTDRSINENDVTQGTSDAKPLYIEGQQSDLPIARFDGIDDSLVNAVVSYSNPDSGNDHLVALVIKINDFTSSFPIASFSDIRWFVSFISNGEGGGFIQVDMNTTAGVVAKSVPIPDGGWHIYGLNIIDGTVNNNMRGFIDGVESGTAITTNESVNLGTEINIGTSDLSLDEAYGSFDLGEIVLYPIDTGLGPIATIESIMNALNDRWAVY